MQTTMNANNSTKVSLDFQVNVVAVEDGKTTVNQHIDGKFTLEVNEVRELIRASVASAIRGLADSLDKEPQSIEDEFSPNSFED